MNGETTTGAILITTALGFVLPALVAILRRVNTPTRIIGVIYMLLCAVAAFVALWLQGQIIGHAGADSKALVQFWIGDFVAVFVQGRAFYSQFYKTVAAELTKKLEDF